jgi:ribosomal protein S18 acetylase RimI-like enzyme
VHLRTARREDQSALAHLLRCVAATQRGGLAREVDEVSDEYVRAMIDALEGGVMILAMAVPGSSAVPESDPCSPASLSPSPPPSSSSPSSSSSCCFEVSLTASCGHVLVGVLKVSPMGPHRCFRHVLTDCTLAVHPHWQRRGIAQHLFAALFARLAEPTMAHVLRVELVARETNRHAVAMYERVGFRVNARLHGRIVTGMPLHLQRNAKEQEQQPSQQDSPPELPTCDVASLRFESDIVMVWFNPAFDERALAAQFDAPAAQSANTNSCAQ